MTHNVCGSTHRETPNPDSDTHTGTKTNTDSDTPSHQHTHQYTPRHKHTHTHTNTHTHQHTRTHRYTQTRGHTDGQGLGHNHWRLDSALGFPSGKEALASESRCSTPLAICDNLWDFYNHTPDPDVVAAGLSTTTQAWRPGRTTHSYLFSLCDAHTLDSGAASHPS